MLIEVSGGACRRPSARAAARTGQNPRRRIHRDMLLSGRIALVTGAAQGNGAAIAAGLAAEGARVVATDLDAAGPGPTAAPIPPTGGAAWALRRHQTGPGTLPPVAPAGGAARRHGAELA